MIDWNAMTQELKIDEGFKPCVYQCTAGKPTIGYGHNLEDNELPEPIAENLLIHDYMKFYDKLCEHQWFCEMDDYRKRIIINMAYNIGISGLLRFRNMIAAIRNKDFNEAADEMVNSNWYDQVGSRSVRLVKMMRNGPSSQ